MLEWQPIETVTKKALCRGCVEDVMAAAAGLEGHRRQKVAMVEMISEMLGDFVLHFVRRATFSNRYKNSSICVNVRAFEMSHDWPALV